MSGDKENEYFSDGLAEEIINALTHIPGLKVIGADVCVRIQGENRGHPTNRRSPGRGQVLEGSVRQAGNRIRVTAQLINAAGRQPSLVGALRPGAGRRVCDPGRDRTGDCGRFAVETCGDASRSPAYAQAARL